MPGPSRTRTRWPAGLLGLLALVAIVEGLAARHDPAFGTVWAADWAATGRAAGREAAGADVLLFGDSQVKFAVAPRLLEARLGRPAYNLAVSLGQAPSSYFLLRRALAAGARPRTIVINAKPRLLTDGPELQEGRWSALLTPAECLDLARTMRDASFFGRTMAGRLLPTVGARHEIRAWAASAWRGDRNGAGTLADLPALSRNWAVNRGALLIPPDPSYRERVDDANPVVWRSSPGCHPVNAGYLRRFLALAAARDIPVYWLVPPISPGWQGRRDALGIDDRFTRLIRALADPFPNVVVLDARHSGYEAGLFTDLTHLDSRGAALLSASVAEALAHPPGPRWVALPAPGAPPAGPLEDLGQSRLAVQPAGRVLR